MDGWMNGWMAGTMEGWMNGWMIVSGSWTGCVIGRLYGHRAG